MISNTSYEVRIFDAVASSWNGLGMLIPGKLIYNKTEIAHPSHKVENYLESCTEYFWTVRAHFLLDSRPQVTEWSGGYTAYYAPWVLRRTEENSWLKKGQSVSSEWFYLPFKTPCTSISSSEESIYRH